MLKGVHPGTEDDDDLVEVLVAGARAAGAFHCSNCGYGVTVQRALPQCPMCAGTKWEAAAWSPFSASQPR